MCGRYSLALSPAELEQIFTAPCVGPIALPRWNIAPTQDAPVVLVDPEGRRIVSLRWGLVPWWAAESGGGARHVNARAESAASRPTFRDALARRRCLVPADGFYEWTGPAGGGPRRPFWIHHRRGGVLALAGLHETWRPRGGAGPVLRTFTVLTTAPNRTVAPLHDRMPAVLLPAVWDAWLDPMTPLDDARALLVPAPDDLLEARAVSTRVNRVEHDDPTCVAPAADDEPGPEDRARSELLDLFEGR